MGKAAKDNSRTNAIERGGGHRNIIYIEALRVFACFFVIFNHTGVYGFFLFSECELGSIQFWVYLFISIFCKFAVPVFFMISGALLLDKEESIKIVYKKRILRIFLVLFIFSAVVYIEKIFIYKFPSNLNGYFERLYTGTITTPYWYLYAFITYLISLPFLRKMVRNLGEKDFFYIIGISIVFTGIIPILEYLCNGFKNILNENLSQWILNSVVLYPTLGYIIEYKINTEKIKRYLPIIWFINILCVLISCLMTYLMIIDTGECSESKSQFFHNSFVSVNATTIFLTAKIYLKDKNRVESHLAKTIYKLAGASFGIYLLHVFIICDLRLKALIFENHLGINYMLNAFIGVLIIMLACYLFTKILMKIPLINKILK